MGWGVMYNGAWDYPADTRGYTWGWVHEFRTPRWSVRYGSFGEPRVANGLRFDRRVGRDRGDAFEGEVRSKKGAVRVLHYRNHADAGRYAGTNDVTATRHPGTLKYGFGVSAEQEIAGGVGVFGRYGWNDGATESFTFTAIDRLGSGGVSVSGARWGRKEDVAASALTVSGLSAPHAAYLARGGLDFIIGDGGLRYGREAVWESYYSARLFAGFFATVDAQYIRNPAYNRDRGPVWAYSLRLHVEGGKK